MSPDGRLVAYTSNESGRTEVYVAPVPGPGGRVQVSTDGGVEPVWNRATGALFYRGPQRLMRASLSRMPDLRIIARDSLFDDPFYYRSGQAFDVFPDGKHFLIQNGDSAPQITVITNWPGLVENGGSRTP
jgi:hypothetical protein